MNGPKNPPNGIAIDEEHEIYYLDIKLRQHKESNLDLILISGRKEDKDGPDTLKCVWDLRPKECTFCSSKLHNWTECLMVTPSSSKPKDYGPPVEQI